LYDRVDWFAGGCHFVNWALLTAAVSVALVHSRTLSLPVVAALCIGFGAMTAILWEIAEFGAFVTKTPERYGLYHDTIGDLALGLLGATVAGTVCAVASYRQRYRDRSGSWAQSSTLCRCTSLPLVTCPNVPLPADRTH
jgi:hypothetical protein